MRASIVILAFSALVLACLDFVLNTRGALAEQLELRAAVREAQEDDIRRLKRNEVPPTAELLRQWADAADHARQVARRGEEQWFARSRVVADYLLHPDDRPGRHDPLQTRDRLRRLLLAQATRLGRIAAPASALGIEFPGATRELSTEPEVLRDQVERAVALRWALDCLPEEGTLDLLQLERTEAGGLRMGLQYRAAPRLALAYFDRFLEPSRTIAPRQLIEYALSVIPPSNWRRLPSGEGPPVLLDLEVELANPEGDRHSDQRTSATEDPEAGT